MKLKSPIIQIVQIEYIFFVQVYKNEKFSKISWWNGKCHPILFRRQKKMKNEISNVQIIQIEYIYFVQVYKNEKSFKNFCQKRHLSSYILLEDRRKKFQKFSPKMVSAIVYSFRGQKNENEISNLNSISNEISKCTDYTNWIYTFCASIQKWKKFQNYYPKWHFHLL